MDEFEKFMKSLENAGILTGWSNFINENDTENKENKETSCVKQRKKKSNV